MKLRDALLIGTLATAEACGGASQKTPEITPAQIAEIDASKQKVLSVLDAKEVGAQPDGSEIFCGINYGDTSLDLAEAEVATTASSKLMERVCPEKVTTNAQQITMRQEADGIFTKIDKTNVSVGWIVCAKAYGSHVQCK